MFSGIVESVCRVVAIRDRGGAGGSPGVSASAAVRLEIDLGDLADGLPLGASVAINGVCLTLADRRGAVGGFDAVPETWRLTNLSALQAGDSVNAERSLRAGDRIDGHFVQGHVDGVGTVDAVLRAGGEYKIWIAADAGVLRFVVRKGSIALDGTSLTVIDVEANRFSVALIPTTLDRTVLGRRRRGDRVNIETDILARIVVSRLEGSASVRASDAGSGLTWDRLQESGFLP